jgi:hypothetical protein
MILSIVSKLNTKPGLDGVDVKSPVAAAPIR